MASILSRQNEGVQKGETCDEIRGDCDLSSAPLTLAETVMREINQGVIKFL